MFSDHNARSNVPTQLSPVCHLFYRVATNTPRLWTSLYISLLYEYMDSSPPQHVHHSATLPLHLSIFVPPELEFTTDARYFGGKLNERLVKGLWSKRARIEQKRLGFRANEGLGTYPQGLDRVRFEFVDLHHE